MELKKGMKVCVVGNDGKIFCGTTVQQYYDRGQFANFAMLEGIEKPVHRSEIKPHKTTGLIDGKNNL